MRVLRLCSVFPCPPETLSGRGVGFDPVGGMQSHTGQLTAELDRLGVHQQVLTTRPPGTPARAAIGQHTVVRRFGWQSPLLRQGYAVPAALAARRLAAGSDLLHAHLGEDLAVLPVAVAAAGRAGIPLVVTVHMSLRHTLAVGGPRSAVLKTVGGSLEAWGCRRAAAVITLTERAATTVRADGGLAPERVHVIPSGVDPARFAGVARDPLPASGLPRVLFVGRLHRAKGVDTLLRALPLLRRPASVVLVGDGPERTSLDRLAVSLGVRDRVAFLGFLPHDQVPAALAYGDIVVLPSRYEELGSVLVEAMHAGRPVVASRTGGIPALVTDGVNGLLTPVGDPAALAAALDRLLADPALACTLGANARSHAAAYGWPGLAGRVLDVYAQATGRPVPAPTRVAGG